MIAFAPSVTIGNDADITDGSIGALALRYIDRRRRLGEIRTSTAREHRTILINFTSQLAGRSPASLRPTDLERWFSSTVHLAAGTRHNYFSVVKGFCDWLVDNRTLKRHPMARMRPPSVPRGIHRALDHAAVVAIMNACHDSRDRAIVSLGFQIGLRRAEIAGLEVGDVSFTGRTIDVCGKGGHGRRVPLTVDAGFALTSYLRDHPASAGPLIRQEQSPWKPVSPDWVGRRFRTLAYEAGVKCKPRDGVATHSMRHTMATDAYVAHRDVMAVADLLGHANLANTQRYVRGLDIERLREVSEGRHYGRRIE